MVKQVSHLLYVGNGSQGQERLSTMLALDKLNEQAPLVWLPRLEVEDDLPATLPSADLYIVDTQGMVAERPFTLITQLKQKTPHIPLLIIATATQESLANQAINRGADYYLIWEQFDAPVLSHVLRLLLHTTRRYRSQQTIAAHNGQQTVISSLQQAEATLEGALDANAILKHFLMQLEQVVAYDTAAIVFINNDIANVVQINATQPHLKNIIRNATLSFRVSQTPNLRQLAETKQPLYIPDVQQFEGWISMPQLDHIRSWMGAPIIIRDRFVAVLDVAKAQPNFYTHQDLHYLEIFAGQIALMLHNTQLYEEVRYQLEQLKVLHTVALLGSKASHEDELIEKVTQVIGDVLYPDNFGVLLLKEEAEVLLVHPSYHKLNWNHDWEEVPLDRGIVGYVARTKRPYRTGDVANDPHYIPAEKETRSQLAVPLLLNEQLIGVINTESTTPYAFSDRDEQLLVTLANQLATAIEKSYLLAAERARRQEAETLRQAAAALTSTLDIAQVLDRILVQLKAVVAYDSAAVLLLQDKRLHLKAARGLPLSLVGQDFSTENKLFDEIWKTQKPLSLTDVRQDNRFEGWGGITHTRGWLGVPLLSRGQILGLLTIDSQHVAAYDQRAITLAQSLADQAAIALENAQLYESARSSAEDLRLVTEVLRILNATPVFEEAFPSIYPILKQIAGATAVCLALLDEDDQWDCAVMHNELEKDNLFKTTMSLTHFADFEQLKNGQPCIVNDTSQHQTLGETYFHEAGYHSFVLMPLMGKQLLGTIGLLWPETNGINKKQLPLLNQIANATALAIERSRLFTEINRQAKQLKQLNELARQLSGQVNIRTLCQLVVSSLHHDFNFINATIFLLDESSEHLILEAVAGSNANRYRPGEYRQIIGQGLIGQAVYTGERVIINDIRSQPGFMAAAHTHIMSELVIPLHADERTVGVLNISSERLNAFAEHDIAMMTLIADQLVVSLEKARLFNETDRRTAELEAVGEISTLLRRSDSIDEMLPLILDQCLHIVGGQQGSIFLYEAESGDLVARWCLPQDPGLMKRRYKPHQGITGYVFTTGEIYITNSLLSDPLAHFDPLERPYMSKLQAAIALPLRAQERVVGVILLGLTKRHTHTRAQVRLLKAVSDIAGSALDRAMVLETLEQRVAARTSELAEANEQLKALDKLKSKFISDMSHELRTPITNLGLYVDLLRQGKPEKRDHYLSVLQQQIKRLGQLMTDILSLSRLQMGRERLEFIPINFSQLVQQVIEGLQSRLQEAELYLRYECDSELPVVNGEPHQLAQVVSHLLTNAINYSMPSQEIVVQVGSQMLEGVAGIQLMVQDSGRGIADEEKLLVFQRFYRGQQVGQSNVPGTGLGLTIVQEVVGLHGGHIDFDSKLGQGSTFWVWLPAKQ